MRNCLTRKPQNPLQKDCIFHMEQWASACIFTCMSVPVPFRSMHCIAVRYVCVFSLVQLLFGVDIVAAHQFTAPYHFAVHGPFVHTWSSNWKFACILFAGLDVHSAVFCCHRAKLLIVYHSCSCALPLKPVCTTQLLASFLFYYCHYYYYLHFSC